MVRLSGSPVINGGIALFSADLTGIDQAAEQRQIISCPFFLGVHANFLGNTFSIHYFFHIYRLSKLTCLWVA